MSPRAICLLSFLVIAFACANDKKPTVTVVEESFLHPESAVATQDFIFVTNQGKRDWKSKDGDGFISKMDRSGKVIEAKFASGLNDPRGMDIYKNYLAVTDITEVALVDLQTGRVVKRIKTPAVFLNDLHVGKNALSYVSDTLGEAIYEVDLETGAVANLLGKMQEAPNGLYTRDGFLYVATWAQGLKEDWSFESKGSLLKINLRDRKRVALSPKDFGHLDSIVPYEENKWLVSDKKAHKVMIFDEKKGSFSTLEHKFEDVADIFYDQKAKLIVAPLTTGSQVKLYRIN